MNEEWRPIPGFEGQYEVSNLGRVKSLGDKRRRSKVDIIMRPYLRAGGCPSVFLVSSDGKHRNRSVAALTALTFPEPILAGEEWLIVPGYEGLYEVSNLGRVRSIGGTTSRRAGYRILKHGLCGTVDYFYVSLCQNGKTRNHLIHRLVAMAFLGEPPSMAYEVNHKNGNTHNNTVDNLEWTTKSGNIKHAFALGLAMPLGGASHPSAKLSWDQADTIREQYAVGGTSYAKLAVQYGVTAGTISNIVGDRSYKDDDIYQ